MTDPEPTIRLRVDPTNPGQFLACCGLLELADHLHPGAEGWFAPGEFRLAGARLPALLDALTGAVVEEVLTLENGLTVKPLLAPLRLELPGRPLLLDGWMTVRLDRGEVVTAANPPWNFWSGQQTPLRIWKRLRPALEDQRHNLTAGELPDLFRRRVPLSSRFGFDPEAAWTPIDVGFSPDTQNIKVASSPALELLAAVGIQRFRLPAVDREMIHYFTWGVPLGPAVAAAAAAGACHAPPACHYRTRVITRGQYAALGYSLPIRGTAND